MINYDWKGKQGRRSEPFPKQALPKCISINFSPICLLKSVLDKLKKDIYRLETQSQRERSEEDQSTSQRREKTEEGQKKTQLLLLEDAHEKKKNTRQ